MDKNLVRDLDPRVGWRHRPLWKRVVNTILRFFQTRRRPARLLVVYTEVEFDPLDGIDGEPRVIGYGLGRVLHL